MWNKQKSWQGFLFLNWHQNVRIEGIRKANVCMNPEEMDTGNAGGDDQPGDPRMVTELQDSSTTFLHQSRGYWPAHSPVGEVLPPQQGN